ncbi:hypothetical protein P691DRAFT_808799 [Macrolepiota fuliginosa MF-IS2]|uniref:Uncharacterized protein n=1 Tax=Macrolepiota fuliginosa MF-IS2 TaxID=1400762 RepID=A0A9P6BZM0_9AGAR|nr:hypothetical protein P691DRAFT_808799 [Macrolepiota fuliginosa MF-IS2]
MQLTFACLTVGKVGAQSSKKDLAVPSPSPPINPVVSARTVLQTITALSWYEVYPDEQIAGYGQLGNKKLESQGASSFYLFIKIISFGFATSHHILCMAASYRDCARSGL